MNIRVLGIIPARGGSKGVPRKNIRMVGGKPLIAYTIEAARTSICLTRFLVSTDDDEIASVATSFGAPVLERPPNLAADDTPMIPVIEDVLVHVEAEDGPYDMVVLLQPTTPLRTAADIDTAVQKLKDTSADSIISVYRVEDCHPSRMYREEQGQLVPYESEPEGRLRQDLPPVYHRNGAIYACRRALIKEAGTLIGPDVRPYQMPRSRSVNIDDPLDLLFAEFLMGSSTTNA
ncbi:MAG TPA: acylneuraminate cytidylyltransferase family protein [Rhodothermales bacterium]|nr:acylneuraminate cytidylyltransferase family protein [Rhodothermales bacterium]